MFLRESLLAESGGGTPSHTTKQTQLNFRAPQPSVFEGCEFRRGVAQAASSKLNLACWAGKAGPRGNNAIPRRENQKPRKPNAQKPKSPILPKMREGWGIRFVFFNLRRVSRWLRYCAAVGRLLSWHVDYGVHHRDRGVQRDRSAVQCADCGVAGG